MKFKKKIELVFQFKELDEDLDSLMGELLLIEVISDWNKLAKRFSLNGDDIQSIERCQFYAGRLIDRFPELEVLFLRNYYDEAICEFIGVEYKIKRDKYAQEIMGFESVLYNKKGYYLFPLN